MLSRGGHDKGARPQSSSKPFERASATIARTLRETGELVCPHTAVGIHVAEPHRGSTPMVTLLVR